MNSLGLNWDWITFLLIIFIIGLAAVMASYSIREKIYFTDSNSFREYKVKKIPFLFSLLLLAVVSGLQVSGVDIPNYKDLYTLELIKPVEFFQIEPLFKIIYRISDFLFHDFQGTVLISSIITLSFVYAALLQYRKYINYGIMIFAYLCIYFLVGFTLLRQMIAISIFLYSLRYIEENKMVKFFLLILLASLFHISVIVCLPCYWLCSEKTKIQTRLFVYMAIVPFTLFILFNIKPVYNYFINQIISEGRYLQYVEDQQIGIGNLVLRLPIIICVLYISFYHKRDNAIIEISKKLILYDVAFSFTYYFLPILNRCSYYFKIAYMFVIIEVCKRMLKNQKERNVMICLIFLCLFVYQLCTVWWLRSSIMPIRFHNIFIR